jgi:glycosyltransferase involved in cell wall biosynthesis
MISMVVPTRNRAHTLRLVAPSYFTQQLVTELIFVIDGGEDETEEVIAAIAAQHPDKKALVLRNDERLGASQSRNIGVARCSNEYVLFCDDDEYLEPDYASTCLAKLIGRNAAAISGRRIYLQPGETSGQALNRFGFGLRRARPFLPLLCEYVNGARFVGDIRLPVTNAVILTWRDLVLRYPFDPFYARGNGYREESDYQMNLFIKGYSIYVTNDCHSLHLPLAQVVHGGQRTSRMRRIYWSIYYTRYFFGKYYRAYAKRQCMLAPRWVALAAFSCFAVYRELLRPSLYRLAMQWSSRGSRISTAPLV